VARDFNGGTDDLAIGTTSSYNFFHQDVVFTISFLAKLDSVAADDAEFFFGNSAWSSSDKGFAIGFDNRVSQGSPKQLRATGLQGAATDPAFDLQFNDAITDTNWHQHVLTTDGSNGTARLYTDGSEVATAVIDAAPFGSGNATRAYQIGNETEIGTFGVDGKMAEVAIWDVTLNASEVSSLGSSFSPLLVRPASLISYWSLIGRLSPELDLVGAINGTVNGAVVFEHPPVLYPTQVITGFDTAAAPPAGISIPVVYHHRQRNF
jgi:hypothetical protein